VEFLNLEVTPFPDSLNVGHPLTIHHHHPHNHI